MTAERHVWPGYTGGYDTFTPVRDTCLIGHQTINPSGACGHEREGELERGCRCKVRVRAQTAE